ncbi:MAE_28990/MAE_18760 family HEPN-like nuclease [Peptacetobacter hiranonis]|uniref:RiboL-PSP-HEPN domain-containing protein n=1 Tax=Peptacetobacter hiranonis (strain DSM 13275 / JCM 10541 / KCTC 15199 / TO-931) TaxID=500633 RepID=B6FW53_PEPHT|nr:MAE_28990/MAE_18760 family HEPN-like nuclease [Peptacetobacter hiranonis]EEA86250.1 hypothetical protein CLOHIR_00102 [Peptacetobacter hiranonis DSM 13275]QEK19949.1 hypothetical protein KGNDJEFE_00426 [Peptacetobacter hiranonis]
MKIKNLEDLQDKIDKDLAWRKKELTSIKSDVQMSNTKERSEQSRAIRAGITLLYAHWEGAIKNISEYYLIYVSSLKLKYSELKNNFLAITMKTSLDKFEETNKATIHNKLIEDIYSKKDEKSNIPCNNVINTKSNLNSKILDEIMALIGVDSSKYRLKNAIIDQRLLGNRNKIAHGERIEQLEGISNINEYIELHDIITNLINDFGEDIKNYAINEKYKSK